MNNKKNWYQKKKVYIPISVAMGFLGGAWIGSFLGVKLDDEFNPDYYKKKEAPIFIKK